LVSRAGDWLRQATRDLEHARRSVELGDYIPTRYPNLHPEGAPIDYYTRADAERAMRYAGEILEFCRGKVL